MFETKGDATDVSVKLDPSAYFVNLVHYYIKDSITRLDHRYEHKDPREFIVSSSYLVERRT
jgi:hypothetical protein